MSSSNCLNCGHYLATNVQFCQACGQKKDIHRFTLGHIFHEIVHAVTHADKGIFHLLKELSIRPGRVAREYLAGKRKKYFNPFTFFILCMGLFVFLNMTMLPAEKKMAPDARVLARIPTEAGKQTYITMMTRGANVRMLMTKHGNVMAMIAIPFISLITWLAFKKQRYNYAEHLTANVFFVPYSNLLFTIVVTPLITMAANSGFRGGLIGGALLIQVLYFTWSFYSMLQLKSSWQLIRTFLVCLFSVMLWGLLVMVFMAIYLYRSWDFYKFFARMLGS
ncbi:MAG: DUF3667 domain-containing protein [Bacteroidota bacterium]